MMEIPITTKSHIILSNHGYSYIFHRNIISGKAWRCIEVNSSKCSARLHSTSTNEVISAFGEHNHVVSTEKYDAIRIYNNMKMQACKSEKPPIVIIAENASKFNEESSRYLPKLDTMKRTIRRTRMKEFGSMKMPKTLEEADIAEYVIKASSGEVYFYDSGKETNKSRFFIFIHNRRISVLENAMNIFMDGSFYSAPSLFMQVFTIHAKVGNEIYPAAYCLLPYKKKTTYMNVFNHIKQKLPKFNPKTIMMDFELSLILSSRVAFPTATVNGCYFHFGQSIIRKVNEKHKKAYQDKENDSFRKIIEKLIRIATLHPDMAITQYNEIKMFLPVDISDYFENTYLGKYLCTNRKTEALFSIDFWNVYSINQIGLPRTNNNIEGWHNYFNRLIGECHPNIYVFVKKLVYDMNLTNLKINMN